MIASRVSYRTPAPIPGIDSQIADGQDVRSTTERMSCLMPSGHTSFRGFPKGCA